MINELMQIEIAYSILKTDSKAEKERDPVDVHYGKLHTEMQVSSFLGNLHFFYFVMRTIVGQ